MRHLLDTASLTGDDVVELLELTDSLIEVGPRTVPAVPTLRGRTVATLFDEDAPRTRLSFETAARRLSADTMTFGVGTAAGRTGGSLRATALTVEAMGVDAVVVRHRSSGAPHRVASWIDVAVVNGGDGWHDHPTQALLDCHTLTRRLGTERLDGVRVAIVGDIQHSRVARADVHAFTALGASVTLVAPPTLLPPSLVGWPVAVSHDLDEVLGAVDAVHLLRVPRDPSRRGCTSGDGLTLERLRRLGDDVVVLHPGPTSRGVEIAPEAADDPRAVIVDQVRDGVAVRMAVLVRLLAGEAAPVPEPAGAVVSVPADDPTTLETTRG